MSIEKLRQYLAVFVCVSLVLLLPLAHVPVGTAAVSGISPTPGGDEADFNWMQFVPNVLRNSVNQASGILDTSFGGDGKVTTDFAGYDDFGSAMALQPDGRILVAGHTGPFVDIVFALARYLADGSLDTSFGGDGRVTTDFYGMGGYGSAIALQPDGRILVAGAASNGRSNDFALARYLGDGSLDTSFGSGGLVTTDFDGNGDNVSAIALQPDGRILVAGTATVVGWDDFALARYLADGSLDTSFGGDGRVTTDFAGNNDMGFDIALQPDGRILVVGFASTTDGMREDFALARYQPDGSLDASFGGGGLVTTNVGDVSYGNSIALQPNGRILVAGGYGGEFALGRYLPNGILDTSFGSGGFVITNFFGAGSFGSGNDIALQPNGRILVAGAASNGWINDFALARYLADGSLDLSFSGDGKVTTDFPGSPDEGYAIALQPDGRIVVAGRSGGDFALARYR